METLSRILASCQPEEVFQQAAVCYVTVKSTMFLWHYVFISCISTSSYQHVFLHILMIVQIFISTVLLIKFLPYSGATAQTRSTALWGVSGSYGQAPAQQGMSGLVRETSHLWLHSSPSPSLQPILREPATSILTVLFTFECIMWVAT